MTRVGGGALAAVGVIALGIAPGMHYATRWFHASKPQAPVVAVKAPVPAPSPASAAPSAASPAKASPDAAPAKAADPCSRRTKDVRVVGHTLTNKRDKLPEGCPAFTAAPSSSRR